jgi:ABC-type multidrug transport system, ATPase component
MIEVNQIKKVYKDGNFALKGVSFKIDKKITSIIGQNGAGKTTLIRILSTQLLPSSGKASINGYDVVKNPYKVREITVSIPQEARPMLWYNSIDLVRMYLCARGMNMIKAKPVAEAAIKRVGLWDSRYKLAGDLSGGQKRKILVAMALASDADVIFLDEPTTGLDPLSRIEVWSAIKAIKGQVILTTHYMEEAQALSDDVIMMEKGKVISQGSVGELLKSFYGLVRVESKRRIKGRTSYKVGNTWISYVEKKKVESFVLKDDIIKPISLDDIFIKKGVNLES